MNRGLQVVILVVYLTAFLLVLGISVLAVRGAFASNQPQVTLDSPADHSQFHVGDKVTVQSTSTDPSGITQVKLSVDGTFIKVDSAPSPQRSFSLIQTWIATAGNHTLSVQALNNENQASDPATISVTVLPTSTQPVSRGRGCAGSPRISSFSANPSTITAGQSATLSWGLVSNADHAEIDPGIGGVATPGSRVVSPSATTTYMLSTRCGSSTTTAQVTITVLP